MTDEDLKFIEDKLQEADAALRNLQETFNARQIAEARGCLQDIFAKFFPDLIGER
jgi:hypothetical protein